LAISACLELQVRCGPALGSLDGVAFSSIAKMKTIFRIVGAPCFMAMLCFLTGCSLRYQKPSGLIGRVAIANRVVAINSLNNFANPLGLGLEHGSGSSGSTNYSLTLTGKEARDIVHAITTLHKPWELTELSSTALYDWRLRFYRGKLFLGEVGICGDMVECGTTEYQGPPILDELYSRITKENMQRMMSSMSAR
jgi:hypothetical protein